MVDDQLTDGSLLSFRCPNAFGGAGSMVLQYAEAIDTFTLSLNSLRAETTIRGDQTI